MKIKPSYMTFKQALSNGALGRIECKAYTKWVKLLPCSVCNQEGCDPHHPHGAGFKGMGTKVPDWWVIPLCRTCHDELHHDVRAWEEANGSQYEHVALTLLQAIREERLILD